jgi:hypothetical protein
MKNYLIAQQWKTESCEKNNQCLWQEQQEPNTMVFDSVQATIQ